MSLGYCFNSCTKQSHNTVSIRTNQAAAALLILISAFLSVRHPPQTLSLVVRLLPLKDECWTSRLGVWVHQRLRLSGKGQPGLANKGNQFTTPLRQTSHVHYRIANSERPKSSTVIFPLHARNTSFGQIQEGWIRSNKVWSNPIRPDKNTSWFDEIQQDLIKLNKVWQMFG